MLLNILSIPETNIRFHHVFIAGMAFIAAGLSDGAGLASDAPARDSSHAPLPDAFDKMLNAATLVKNTPRESNWSADGQGLWARIDESIILFDAPTGNLLATVNETALKKAMIDRFGPSAARPVALKNFTLPADGNVALNWNGVSIVYDTNSEKSLNPQRCSACRSGKFRSTIVFV